ncbi:DUF736 family protein [Sphingopyxis panaciterrulae]|uniref:Uncharacterized protein (DUF736 family) n=1 Tax=Sphingopyxis panaciterrulae TaxID=462372 RepID=A0A7W9ER53_9SPHN|nr:DUF736 family protein [Sphingopyxis panaciterrulae]MBB5707338.1 uncharacterized protein (DUF736 family) [Sphingopyxis panaciterrulae]
MANGNQITVGGFKDTGGLVTGWVSTAQINAQYVELRPVERRSERSPSYEAWARGREGNLYHLGTLWPRQMRRDGSWFHGGFITDRGKGVSMDVAVFGDFAVGADMVSKEDGDDYVSGRAQSSGGSDQRQGNGGFSGGSTAGPNGEYVGDHGGGANGFQDYSGGMTGGAPMNGGDKELDDDVPF